MAEAHLEAWSDLEAAGGTRLSSIPDVLDAEIERVVEQKDEKGVDSLKLTLPRRAPAWDDLTDRRVVRLVEGSDVLEYRIVDRDESEDADGRLIGELACEGVLYDLGYRTEILRRVEANGLVDPHFEINQRTPAEHVDIILGGPAPYQSGAPSHFQAGTIEPTDPVDMIYDWDTPLSALRELLRRIDGRAELSVTRSGTSAYDINIVRQVGSSASTVYFSVGRGNVHSVRKERTARKQATRVSPRGAEVAGAAATMASHAWPIASIGGSTITFEDEILNEDGQLTGFYAEKPDGSLTEVTASTSPDQVTVADATGLGAGDVITFREDSSGTELTHLEAPSAVSSYGLIPKVLDRQDIPAVDVLNENPYLDSWSGGLPDGTSSIGAPTITESNDPAFTGHGGASAHVTADAGEGIAMSPVGINPTANRPFFTGQARLWPVSGSLRIELVDVTTGKTWPPGEAQESQVTTITGQWVERLGIRPGEDFNEAGSSQLQLQLVAQEDGTEFYLDAWMLTQTEGGVETYYHDRGSHQLWFAALDELALHAEPVESYRVDAADLNRIDPSRWPDEPLVLGADVRVRAPSLDTDATTRIVRRRWDPCDPTDAEVTFETEEERLSRLLARTRRRRRKRKPPKAPQTNRPDDISGVTGEYGQFLKLEWDPSRGTVRYDWRIQGSGGSAVERWENGTELFNTDGTSYVQRGITTDPLDLVGRAISATGKPSRGATEISFDRDVAVDTPSSVNLLGEDAGPERVAPGGTYRYLDKEPIATLSLEVGDKVSVSADMHGDGTSTSAGQMLIGFFDSGGSQIGGFRQSTETAQGSTAFEGVQAEAVEIPVNTVSITVQSDNVTNDGTDITVRRVMLNRGPVAAPYSDPPSIDAENLLGFDALVDKSVGTGVTALTGFLPLSTLGVSGGDVLSVSQGIVTDNAGETYQTRMLFRDSGASNVLDERGGEVTGSGRSRLHGIVIPSTAVEVRMFIDDVGSPTGGATSSKRMLNRGARAAPFSIPKFAFDRDDFGPLPDSVKDRIGYILDNVRDGTTYGRVLLDALGSGGEIDLGASGGWQNKDGTSIPRRPSSAINLSQSVDLAGQQWAPSSTATPEIYSFDSDTSALSGVTIGVRKVNTDADDCQYKNGGEVVTIPATEISGLNGETLYYVYYDRPTDTVDVTENPDQAIDHGRMVLGSITTPTDTLGGGGGSGTPIDTPGGRTFE